MGYRARLPLAPPARPEYGARDVRRPAPAAPEERGGAGPPGGVQHVHPPGPAPRRRPRPQGVHGATAARPPGRPQHGHPHPGPPGGRRRHLLHPLLQPLRRSGAASPGRPCYALIERARAAEACGRRTCTSEISSSSRPGGGPRGAGRRSPAPSSASARQPGIGQPRASAGAVSRRGRQAGPPSRGTLRRPSPDPAAGLGRPRRRLVPPGLRTTASSRTAPSRRTQSRTSPRRARPRLRRSRRAPRRAEPPTPSQPPAGGKKPKREIPPYLRRIK